MSTTANFFIEVKNNKTGKWGLLTALYPYVPQKIERVVDGKLETIISKPYMSCEQGDYDIFTKFWQQGSVRDLFNNMMINSSVAKRGLPSDISSGANAWFNEQQERIEKENQEYFEKYGEKRTWGGKWWFNESYATLDELWKVFDKMFDEWKARTRKVMNESWTNSKLVKKMDEVLYAVQHPDKPKQKKMVKTEVDEDDINYYEEDVTYQLEEDVFDVFNIYAFIRTINTFVECLTGDWHSDSNIRIVTYSD